MRRPRDIGTNGERAVVDYLRRNGFPQAERRSLHGADDMGDIVGCPGVVIEIKAGRGAEQAGDGRIAEWLAETEEELLNAAVDIGILVTKRAGYGSARVGSWWAHMTLGTLAGLVHDSYMPLGGAHIPAPVRMHLHTAVWLLRTAGFGDPIEEAA